MFFNLKRKTYTLKGHRFYFENVWLREDECKGIVQNSWERAEGLGIMDKIKICGDRLFEWGGGMCNEYKKHIQECRDLLRRFWSRRDALCIQRYNKARWDYLNLLEKQEVYWKQRVKQHWLREWDKNTRFFHRFASARRQNNKLDRLKDANSDWQETIAGVQSVINEYFTELFMSLNTDGKLSEFEAVNQISATDNEALIAEITCEKVKAAVFFMHPDKASGPDGFNPAFYQAFWDVVQQDVVEICRIFMSTG